MILGSLSAEVTTCAVAVESLPPEKEIMICSRENFSAAWLTKEYASSFKAFSLVALALQKTRIFSLKNVSLLFGSFSFSFAPIVSVSASLKRDSGRSMDFPSMKYLLLSAQTEDSTSSFGFLSSRISSSRRSSGNTGLRSVDIYLVFFLQMGQYPLSAWFSS
jgi:hypothetical protein